MEKSDIFGDAVRYNQHNLEIESLSEGEVTHSILRLNTLPIIKQQFDSLREAAEMQDQIGVLIETAINDHLESDGWMAMDSAPKFERILINDGVHDTVMAEWGITRDTARRKVETWIIPFSENEYGTHIILEKPIKWRPLPT